MRILLADTQSQVRFALRALLEERPGLEIVGEAADPESVLAQAETTRPDLVLLHWRLGDLATDDLLSVLRRICPSLYVIALSGRVQARQAALAAGADAFVSKGDPPERLLAAIDCFGHSSTGGACRARPGRVVRAAR